MNNFASLTHFILIYKFFFQIYGQNIDHCSNISLSKGYTLWKNIQFEELTISWTIAVCINSSDCLGIEAPYNESNYFQQKPLHIQKEISVLFSSNFSHVEFFKVIAGNDFKKCDFSSAIKLEGHTVSISNNYLTFGNNYFIAKSDDSFNVCLFGYKLNITVHNYDCLDRNKTCNGQGICAAHPWDNQFKCICCRSFIGSYCDEVNGCYNINCHNRGMCIDIPDKESPSKLFRCQCPAGFEGQMCETQVAEYCHVNECMNGGTCFLNLSSPLSYSCSCPALFEGKVCENSKDFCFSNPCLNGGICMSNSQYPYYLCHCLRGFMGLNCELDRRLCTEMNCKNGGICNEFKNINSNCTCLPNYYGKDCSILNTACNSNPCLNTSKCIENESGYKCICQSGNNCTININKCESSPCQPDQICIYDEEGYTCKDEKLLSSKSTVSIFLQFTDYTSTSNDKVISKMSVTYIVIGCILTSILLILILICCTYRYFLKNNMNNNKIKYDTNSFSNCKSDVKPDELFCEDIYPKLLELNKKHF